MAIEAQPGSSLDLVQVLERITDAFMAMDAQWRITFVNRHAQIFFGLSRQQLVGHVYWDLFPHTAGTTFEIEYRRAMNEQIPIEFVARSPSFGMWLEVRGFPAPDGLTVYFRDVSERVEFERALAMRARQDDTAAELGRLVLRKLGLGELRRRAVATIARSLEADAVEILEAHDDFPWLALRAGTGWSDLRARERVGRGTPAGAAHLENRVLLIDDLTGSPYDDPALRAGGFISAAVAPFGEDLARGVLGLYWRRPGATAGIEIAFLQTIATMLGEATLLVRTREALAAKSNQVIEILESLTDGFISVDRDGRVRYANRVAERWAGKTRDELVGRPLAMLMDADNKDLWGKYRRAMATRSVQSAEYYSATRGRWYEVRAFPAATGLSLYFRDVTRRRRLTEKTRELNVELEQRVLERTRELSFANRELESFAHSVSHDLRAPLRAIDGFSQALAEDYGPQLGSQGQSYIDRVRRACGRMGDLIDAMLTLSRVARASMERQAVNLTAIAREIVDELRRAEPDRPVEIVIADGMQVRGQRALMATLLQNLIGNAWKFTRGRTPAVIEIGPVADKSDTYFVRDNGAGFDMTYAGKLFSAFSRLHTVEQYEGTGIGLATVARIVHRHGGQVGAEGAVGQGATFTFSIPASGASG